MSEFDPGRPAVIHDVLTNEVLPYFPDSKADFLKFSNKRSDGKVEWDGMLLDGWRPADMGAMPIANRHHSRAFR